MIFWLLSESYQWDALQVAGRCTRFEHLAHRATLGVRSPSSKSRGLVLTKILYSGEDGVEDDERWLPVAAFKILLLQIILNFSYQVGMENVAKTKNIQPELKAHRVATPTLSRNRLQNILSSLWIPLYRNLSFISQSQFRYTTQKTQSTSYYRITSIYNRQNHHLRISMIKITYLQHG